MLHDDRCIYKADRDFEDRIEVFRFSDAEAIVLGHYVAFPESWPEVTPDLFEDALNATISFAALELFNARGFISPLELCERVYPQFPRVEAKLIDRVLIDIIDCSINICAEACLRQLQRRRDRRVLAVEWEAAKQMGPEQATQHIQDTLRYLRGDNDAESDHAAA